MLYRHLKDLKNRVLTASTIPGLIIVAGGVMVLSSMLNIAGLVGLLAIAGGAALIYSD